MKLKLLKPRADNTVQLVVSIFTQGDMEAVPANSPHYNQLAPLTVNIEIAQEGLFDLDVIEGIIKKHLNPKTLRWVNTGGKRPVFVPFGKKATSEIPQHLYDNPKIDKAVLGHGAVIAVKDGFSVGVKRLQQVPVRGIFLYISNDKTDPNNIPGLPLGARLGEKSEVAHEADVTRFFVGHIQRGVFHQLSCLPVPIEVPKLLPEAQRLAQTRSCWITEPPTEIEFETSMLEIEEIKKEMESTDVPYRITMIGKRLAIYATDRGNPYCPEALNYKPNKKGYVSGEGIWSFGRDGKIFEGKDDPDNHLLHMAIIYGGPTYIFRFTVKTGVNEVNLFAQNCAAYLTQVPWYVEMIKKFRPDLLEGWEAPEDPNGHKWYFMSSDWCMRNDANVKRGSAGNAAGEATIDLYSRPYLTLKRWVHGPYRAKYRQSQNSALPGTTVHKSSVGVVELQNLLKHVEVHGGDQFAGLHQAMNLPKVKKKG